MQKLLVEFENTPEDAPQVLCSVSGALNREETLSVPDNAGNSEQVEIPAGLDRIKNHCYNFKMEEWR